MLQVARLCPRVLLDAADLVVAFLRSQMNPDGGFADRAGASDLYYTVFGIEALSALRAEVPADRVRSYLQTFGDGAALDMVHLACLARGWACAGAGAQAPAEAIISRMETFRTPDGGYNAVRGWPQGTLYGCFLATGAYQDLGADIPNPQGLARCIESMRAADGGYSNLAGQAEGLTPSTAAAVALLRQLGEPAPESAGEWLLSRCRPDGGFFASPAAPIPDLLSTATALHALAGLHADFSKVKEPCLDFIDTLWTSRGGFLGSWADEILDCEYTWYGLLALGHLSF